MEAAFLSCLFGSEVQGCQQPQLLAFLSCLFGSEDQPAVEVVPVEFLSCLFGSEVHILDAQAQAFVSELPIRQ